jgi:F-type H+-transporting ATPase subunit gamma
MPNPTEIRRHIAAVEQTKKITGAMEMISSNRMKRVMSHIEQNHHYFDSVRRTMKHLLMTSQGFEHPYLKERPGLKHTYLVIAGDKGLCGAYNSSVLNFARDTLLQYPERSLITIGIVAEEYFHSRGMTPDSAILGIAQDPTLTRARRLVREIMQLYDDGLIGEFSVIYTSFYGQTKNKPIERRLLPIRPEDYSDIEVDESMPEIIYHPSPEKVFDMLVPQYILGIIFGVMVQAYASEHYARMNAMHSATMNANDMLKNLRDQYNMVRQSAITNEIAEITGAAEILRGG